MSFIYCICQKCHAFCIFHDRTPLNYLASTAYAATATGDKLLAWIIYFCGKGVRVKGKGVGGGDGKV